MKRALVFTAILLTFTMTAPTAQPDATPAKVVVPANHPHVQIIGRVDDSDAARPRFSFPGVTIRARFEADSIALLLADEGLGDLEHTNVYTVLVNNRAVRPLVPVRDATRYVLAEGLGEGTHTIEIRKRTEGLVGAARFLGFELAAGGKLLEPPPRPERRIEFIGDSITCGYGNMVAGDPPGTTFTSINENHDVAFGALTTAMLAAESHSVAYSGRGVFRAYGGETRNQMPTIYHRAVADDARPRWNHSRWSPHVIVINLGTNDFAQPGLRNQDFRGAYERFVDELRGIHPDAVIFCTLGPLLNDGWPEGENSLTRARESIMAVVDQRIERGDGGIHFHEFAQQRPPYGESWHPSRATHLEMAQSLAERIAMVMEWNNPQP